MAATSTLSATTTDNHAPNNAKTRATSPNNATEAVELTNVSNDTKKKDPDGEDLMQFARLGDVGSIQKLFENGRYNATYKDGEGITPLHWAAINNQYAVCKYLLDCGADVNARGGESIATPAMWAAQRCHYYVVNLLLQRGADPLLVDSQGFNILHLATIDGNAFILVLLLHQEIPVDVADPQGHTSLMWAAYKGVPACVDLLLRWGANPNAGDEKGLTALHWSLVRGSQPCIQKIVEYGADRFAKTVEGKTPAVVAEEMKSTRIYHRALDECGYDEDGNLKVLPFGLISVVRNKSAMAKFFFLWPFMMLWIVFTILSHMVIFAAVPIALVAAAGLQWVAGKACQWCVHEYRGLHRTSLCRIVLRDTWTWVLTAWTTLQLTWVTMLLVVQVVQISRNQTTFENMKSHSIEHNLPGPTSQALTSAVTTGTTSFEAGGLSSTGMGPNPAAAARHHPPARRREGCFTQWKKLLGLDAFVATASDGLADRRTARKNPFSRGIITNCKDFFCEPSPYFGRKTHAVGMLDGEIIDYTKLYDTPLRIRSRGSGGMMYRSVAGDADAVGEDAV
ncbi:MAG: hypothetical protein Q9227_006286 [Pyrenula ochraceoflavens]